MRWLIYYICFYVLGFECHYLRGGGGGLIRVSLKLHPQEHYIYLHPFGLREPLLMCESTSARRPLIFCFFL